MKIIKGILHDSEGSVRCPFVEDQLCGVWCHHCTIVPNMVFNDSIPKKLFGFIPYTTWGIVEDGEVVRINCGTKQIEYELQND